MMSGLSKLESDPGGELCGRWVAAVWILDWVVVVELGLESPLVRHSGGHVGLGTGVIPHPQLLR